MVDAGPRPRCSGGYNPLQRRRKALAGAIAARLGIPKTTVNRILDRDAPADFGPRSGCEPKTEVAL